MKKSSFCFAFLTAAMPVSANTWHELYGDRIEFDVHRNDEVIGHYVTRFSSDGQSTRVEADMQLRIPILWLWEYEYSYQASEQWRDDQLVSLIARVDDDGDHQTVELRHEEGRLVGSGPAGEIEIEGSILPTHHYNAAVVNARRVFNTLTGRENQVRLQVLGREPVSVGQGSVDATRYRYEGELDQTEVWYDEQGRWLGLRFPGKDGETIEFVCRRCGYRADL